MGDRRMRAPSAARVFGPRQIVPLCLLLAAPFALRSQVVLQAVNGNVRVFNTDLAVLEAQDPRKDLPCTVTPSKPTMGFDLRFHAGFEVSVPLQELAGGENLLTILFRVTPESHRDETVYFSQRVRVPLIEDDAKGDAYLQGTFDLGEGKFHVDWLMRDRSERVCSSYWDSEAILPVKDKQIEVMIPPDSISASEREQFREEPPVERSQGEPLSVKVLVNFAPQNANSSALQPVDTGALVSILRTISRDPRIGKFSIVAFNLHERRVVYRQDDADRIDFPKIGEALETLQLGTIDMKRLAEKNGETDFLTALITKEIRTGSQPDALIFAGPKAMLNENVPADSLKDVGEVEYPVFYMNYNLNPQQVPWKDSISHAVRFFKGYEYTISRPRDLWFAVSEMVGRIVKSKHSHRAAGAVQ